MNDTIKSLLNDIQTDGNYKKAEFEEFTLWLDGILAQEPVEKDKSEVYF